MAGERDLNKKVAVSTTVTPAARTAVVTGATVDLSGYRQAMFIAHVGIVTDGTFTPVAQESADDVTYTSVAASDLSGAFAAFTAAGSTSVQEVGYLGSKRYIRASVTASGTTTGGVFGVTVVRAGAVTEPQ